MTMGDVAGWVAMAVLVFVGAGTAGAVLAARHGPAILWAALGGGAVLGAIGWALTREPVFGMAALHQSILIYFILLPGYVALTGGALMGALGART